MPPPPLPLVPTPDDRARDLIRQQIEATQFQDGARRRRAAVALLTAAGLVAGITGWSAAHSGLFPTATVPQALANEAWARQANTALATVTQHLDEVSQAGQSWRNQPALLRAQTPAAVTSLFQRKAVLEQQQTTLTGELQIYRSVGDASQRIRNTDSQLDEINQSLNDLDDQPGDSTSEPEEASVRQSMLRQRDVYVSQRRAQEQELATLQDGVSAAKSIPLPSVASDVDSLVGQVRHMVADPTAPRPGPGPAPANTDIRQAPEGVSPREQEDPGRQDVGNGAPPTPGPAKPERPGEQTILAQPAPGGPVDGVGQRIPQLGVSAPEPVAAPVPPAAAAPAPAAPVTPGAGSAPAAAQPGPVGGAVVGAGHAAGGTVAGAGNAVGKTVDGAGRAVGGAGAAGPQAGAPAPAPPPAPAQPPPPGGGTPGPSPAQSPAGAVGHTVEGAGQAVGGAADAAGRAVGGGPAAQPAAPVPHDQPPAAAGGPAAEPSPAAGNPHAAAPGIGQRAEPAPSGGAERPLPERGSVGGDLGGAVGTGPSAAPPAAGGAPAPAGGPKAPGRSSDAPPAPANSPDPGALNQPFDKVAQETPTFIGPAVGPSGSSSSQSAPVQPRAVPAPDSAPTSSGTRQQKRDDAQRIMNAAVDGDMGSLIVGAMAAQAHEQAAKSSDAQPRQYSDNTYNSGVPTRSSAGSRGSDKERSSGNYDSTDSSGSSEAGEYKAMADQLRSELGAGDSGSAKSSSGSNHGSKDSDSSNEGSYGSTSSHRTSKDDESSSSKGSSHSSSKHNSSDLDKMIEEYSESSSNHDSHDSDSGDRDSDSSKHSSHDSDGDSYSGSSHDHSDDSRSDSSDHDKSSDSGDRSSDSSDDGDSHSSDSSSDDD